MADSKSPLLSAALPWALRSSGDSTDILVRLVVVTLVVEAKIAT
jgi:hypothetical protein